MSIASGFTKMKNYILTSSGYKLLSRWTSSQTVHMGDGTDDTDTVEYRFGAMKGVTSSLATDNDEFALSASAGKNLQDQCTQLNQSLTVNKIDLLIDDNKNCKFNCDGYKYLLICAVNDSKIINVDLLKLIGSINLGFIRYSSESYIGTCSMNIKPTYITLHGFYNKGYSYSTYQVYGIK